MPSPLGDRALCNASRALVSVSIPSVFEHTGGNCEVLKVERQGHVSFLLITVEGTANGQPLYAVGFYADEETDGETLSAAVDVHGLLWIVAAFRRGMVA